MAIFTLMKAIVLFVCFMNIEAVDLSHKDIPEFIGLMSPGIETIPSPLAFGHKYMTAGIQRHDKVESVAGGAGEGSQLLRPDSNFEEREKVKSDNILPSYCEPPNPCPLGYTAADGCLEEFENSAEFSRNYQARQTCICDQEHMFNEKGHIFSLGLLLFCITTAVFRFFELWLLLRRFVLRKCWTIFPNYTEL
ncbi:Neuroendocrine protein 7B2 [Dirofilaria immitis]|nr:Neuroendocrine protein 7B2 [Dirofilaria immitis]